MEATIDLNDTACPGCHFRCKLAKYQCGRGKEFYEMAVAGEQLPERKGPMLTPSEREALGGSSKPPVDGRVMHALIVMRNVIERQLAESPEHRVVQCLARGGRFMSLPILSQRAHLTKDELRAVLDDAIAVGLITEEREDHCGFVARLTDAGMEQASVWQEQRDAKVAEFLSPLTNDEKEALESTLRKLFPRR